jgi:hypothetical protein
MFSLNSNGDLVYIILFPQFGQIVSLLWITKPQFMQVCNWSFPEGAPQAIHVGSPMGFAAPQ